MIDLIMFHSGNDLPDFLEDNFKQIRLFNSEIKIYFLTDKKLLINTIFDKYSVVALDKDDFYSNKIREFESFFNYGSNNFWTLAATRLIYIENFMRSYNIENAYHFENDVLLYYNLEENHGKLDRFYKNIAITTGGPDKSMTGFMFIKNYLSLSLMTDFFINTLKIYGILGTIRRYGMDMVHEMSLMKFYGIEKGNEYIANLPILPFGEFSEHYLDFNSIFDPATWGQFVGGTRTEGPGAKPQDHYIGIQLKKNPTWNVIWIEENGLKIPYFNNEDDLFKINNLHIHSKNLNKYLSK